MTPFDIAAILVSLATIIFLLIATGLAYMAYQNIWADKKKAA